LGHYISGHTGVSFATVKIEAVAVIATLCIALHCIAFYAMAHKERATFIFWTPLCSMGWFQ